MSIKPGTVLPNGATVLQQHDDQVLCLWEGGFVVWSINVKTLDTFWGHYSQEDFRGAVGYYLTKTTRVVQGGIMGVDVDEYLKRLDAQMHLSKANEERDSARSKDAHVAFRLGIDRARAIFECMLRGEEDKEDGTEF